MQLLKKIFRNVKNMLHGNESEKENLSDHLVLYAQDDISEKPSSFYVVEDKNPETAKKQIKEILGIMGKIEQTHRGDYLVMHTMVTPDLLRHCRDDVSAVQVAFDAAFQKDVVDLGIIDFRSFQHLSANASGDEGVVATAIHGKIPLNADYDFSSNWRYKKQLTAMNSREVKEISQALSTLDLNKFCKEHAISQTDVWILSRLSENYRQASENGLAMVLSCR